MNTETRLSVVRCARRPTLVARATTGFWIRRSCPLDMDLRDEMQQIALAWPSYGKRRMRRELQARGWDVNRKRVQRLLREDNLLCVTKRKVGGDHRFRARPEGLS